MKNERLRTDGGIKVGIIVAVNVSAQKGMRKSSVPTARFVAGHGIEGDAHAGLRRAVAAASAAQAGLRRAVAAASAAQAGDSIRQVSLLAMESIGKMNASGLELGPGDFAENLTTRGIDFSVLKIGDRLKIGNDAVIEISQIGKVSHERCAIYHQAGDCVMPREGVFARVIEGGFVAEGDVIRNSNQ